MEKRYLGKVLLSIVLILGGFLNAQANRSKYIDGEGRFVSQDGDGLSFIKKQLLASAFRDILSKEFKTLGLDAEFFWSRYDQKFNESFEPVQEKLKEKYGIREGEKVSSAKRKQFKKVLRLRKKSFKARYGNLGRAISQYSIKRMTRSPQVPNARYIRVQAKVNRKILRQLYLRFTTENRDRAFHTLYLSADFKVENMAWNDMGVKVESDFTSVVLDHWKEKLTEGMKSQVERIVVVDEGVRSELNQHMKVSKEILLGLVQEAEKNLNSGIFDNNYTSSLWVKLNFVMSKMGEEPLLKKREYKIRGDIVLIDLADQKIVAYEDFASLEKNYTTSNAEKLSSNLASLVYRIPLEAMKEFPQKLASLPPQKSKVLLEVSPYRNIGDVLTFLKFVGEKGIVHQFSASLKGYSKNKANVFLEFSGASQEAKKVLLSLNGKKISPNIFVKIPNLENPFMLGLETISTGERTSGEMPEEGVDREKSL